MNKVHQCNFDNQILIVTKPLGPLKLFQAVNHIYADTISSNHVIISSQRIGGSFSKKGSGDVEADENVSLKKLKTKKVKDMGREKKREEKNQPESPVGLENNVPEPDSEFHYEIHTGLKENGTFDSENETDNFDAFRSKELRLPMQNILQEQKKERGKDEKVQVLVVEDNHVNQMIMRKQLEKLNVSFEVTGSGEEGIEIWKKHCQDIQIIFMDVEVDGPLDGLQSTSVIRNLEKQMNEENADKPDFQRLHTYIVIMTGRSLEEDHMEAFSFGCDDFLTKPVKLDTVIHLVTQQLRLQKP